MDRHYSQKIAQVAADHLNEKGLHFDFDEEKGVFQLNAGIDGMMKYVKIYIIIRRNSFITCINANIRADAGDPKMMADMAEFICRANYDLLLGKFEFDMDDGEIRYSVFENCEFTEPSSDLVAESLYTGIAMMERHSKGILNIIFGGMDPAEAVKLCERRKKTKESDD